MFSTTIEQAACEMYSDAVGTIPKIDFVQGLREAAFADVQIIDTQKDLNVLAQVDGLTGYCEGLAFTKDSPS